MMRTFCFSFLLLASSQMVMSSQPVVRGTLFGEWRRSAMDPELDRVVTCVILPSAPYKHALVCASGFITGITLAMGISPLSPLLLHAPISFWLSRNIIVKRANELHENFCAFNNNNAPANDAETYDERIGVKTALWSLILPTCIGIAGVVLYNLASRYQLNLPLR